MEDDLGNVSPGSGSARNKGPSSMAEKVAVIRACESCKPENERICYDPYAIRFIDAETRGLLARNPEASRQILAAIEGMLPGIPGALAARVRYFDEIVEQSAEAGFLQFVILGAGYDTRAYRIESLRSARVFEVDHPGTSVVKVGKIREIFGALPVHVAYVPVDFETNDLGQRLAEYGYDPSKRTLFVMEGLIMYLSPASVDGLLAFVTRNAGGGSAVLFDYCPRDKGNSDGAGWDGGRKAAGFVQQQGEPLKSAIEGPVEAFLAQRGFTRVRSVSGDYYRQAYFHGVNADRAVCDIYGVAYGEVE